MIEKETLWANCISKQFEEESYESLDLFLELLCYIENNDISNKISTELYYNEELWNWLSSKEQIDMHDIKREILIKIERADKIAEREYEEAILRAVVENAKMDIPAVMVEQEIDRMVQNLAQRLQYQGLTLEQYFQFTGTDAEKMREYMKENAETKVKTELVLEALQKAEKMEVLDEELKEKASEVAKLYGANDEKMVELLLQNQREALVADVMTSKVINFLKENN